MRILNVAQDVSRDFFSGSQNGDSGRIAHHELAADPANRLVDRKAFLLRIECFLRGGNDNGINVFLREQAALGALVQSANLSESGAETLHLLETVSNGEVGKNVAQITKLYLNVIIISQSVIHLNASHADVECVNTELRGIKIINAVTVDKLSAEGVVVADGIDLISCILRKVLDLCEDFTAMQRKLSAADVEAAHQEIASAGGLRQIDDLTGIACMHLGTNQEEA